jgi:hypothetical protein
MALSWGPAGEVAARNSERLEALAYFDKAIDALYWLGHRIGLAAVLARVGGLLAEQEPEAAAVLFGAVEAMAPGFTHSRAHVKARERAISTLEPLIGAARHAELHTQGEVMTESDATRYAHAAISRALREEKLE